MCYVVFLSSFSLQAWSCGVPGWRLLCVVAATMVYESNDPGGDRQHSLKQSALHAVLDVVLLVAALRVVLLVLRF